MIFLKDKGAESEKSGSVVPLTVRGLWHELTGPLLGTANPETLQYNTSCKRRYETNPIRIPEVSMYMPLLLQVLCQSYKPNLVTTSLNFIGSSRCFNYKECN